MPLDEPSGPDLDGVVADANAVGLDYVVIGGFKRLAGRPQDRRDLEELESFHGELPIDSIPGLDT
jgi:molybdopterin-guanine dinucleotide biosynthesis protein